MRNFFAIGLIGLSLTACDIAIGGGSDSGDDADAMMMATGPMPLMTQSDLAAITGKTLTFAPGQAITLFDNGTITGNWDGVLVQGTYVVRDGFVCRVLTAGPRGPSPEDCQIFVLDGDQLNVTRDQGNGASFSYTVS